MVSTPAKPTVPVAEEVAEVPSLLPGDPGSIAAPICIRLPESWEMTDLAFIELSQNNEPWMFETTEEGSLLIMVGEAPETSSDLGSWNHRNRLSACGTANAKSTTGWVLGPPGASHR